MIYICRFFFFFSASFKWLGDILFYTLLTKVINIMWKQPLPASSCNAHHLILYCFLPTAPRTWCRWLQQEGKSTLRTFTSCIWDKAVLNVSEMFHVVVAQWRQLSHMQYLVACASRLYSCEHLNRTQVLICGPKQPHQDCLEVLNKRDPSQLPGVRCKLELHAFQKPCRLYIPGYGHLRLPTSHIVYVTYLWHIWPAD